MKPAPTYTVNHLEESITCLVCGMTSFHPMDVRELYCGSCRQFHTVLEMLLLDGEIELKDPADG